MQLAEFYLCYRQHEPPQTWRQLQAMGLTKVPDPEPALDEIVRQAKFLDRHYFQFLQSVTRDEAGNICDDVADDT